KIPRNIYANRPSGERGFESRKRGADDFFQRMPILAHFYSALQPLHLENFRYHAVYSLGFRGDASNESTNLRAVKTVLFFKETCRGAINRRERRFDIVRDSAQKRVLHALTPDSQFRIPYS